jgi:NADH-quinone oxidoreductase subunit C
MSWPLTEDALAALGNEIVTSSTGAVAGAHVAYGELTLTGPANRIVEALTALRDQFGFHQLIDLCGVDYPDRALRFDVVYHLLSMSRNARVRIKVQTDEDTPVPTVTGVFPCADWYEREAFDMYGVFFEGHPDLRRILTDYGFHGHPRRRAQARRLRAGEVGRVPQLGLHEPLGRRAIRAARRRESGG